jgi:hypothetical protein
VGFGGLDELLHKPSRTLNDPLCNCVHRVEQDLVGFTKDGSFGAFLVARNHPSKLASLTEVRAQCSANHVDDFLMLDFSLSGFEAHASKASSSWSGEAIDEVGPIIELTHICDLLSSSSIQSISDWFIGEICGTA